MNRNTEDSDSGVDPAAASDDNRKTGQRVAPFVESTEAGGAASEDNRQTGQRATRSNPDPATPEPTAVWLRWLFAAAVIVVTVQWVRLTRQQPSAVEIRRGPAFHAEFRVDINQATWVEWMQLEGIGPSLAHRIVADRELNGPFASIDDMMRVSGIGPKTLDRIRPWLRISHDNAVSTFDESGTSEPSGRIPY